MSNDKCPCEDCICLAICRHKEYPDLFQDCILLREYEPAYSNHKLRSPTRIYSLQAILNPTIWVHGYDPDYYTKRPVIYRKTYKRDTDGPVHRSICNWI